MLGRMWFNVQFHYHRCPCLRPGICLFWTRRMLPLGRASRSKRLEPSSLYWAILCDRHLNMSRSSNSACLGLKLCIPLAQLTVTFTSSRPGQFQATSAAMFIVYDSDIICVATGIPISKVVLRLQEDAKTGLGDVA